MRSSVRSKGLVALILRDSSAHAHTSFDTHLETDSASLNFNHKNALRIVSTVGGSEGERQGRGRWTTLVVGGRICRRRERKGRGYKARRMQKGDSPTFEWKRLERIERREARGQEKKRRQIGEMARRRTTKKRRMEEPVYAEVDCSIVKCTSAALKKKALLSV